MKTVLITGCSAGFGKETVMLLANKGYHVIAGIRNVNTSNHAVTQELLKNRNVQILELDLTSVDSITSAIDSVKSKKIDVLINNAGVCGVGFTETHALEKVKNIFDVNVFGLYEFTRKVIPVMREQKEGLIISITSIVGRIVMPLWGAYCASKFAAEALAETWRFELMPLGIDSVIVEPGPHPTTSMGTKMAIYSGEMPSNEVIQQYGSVAHSLQEFGNQLKLEIESGTFQKPEEVAQAIAELIEMPFGKRPVRTIVDRQLKELLTGLNNYTETMYKQMSSAT